MFWPDVAGKLPVVIHRVPVLVEESNCPAVPPLPYESTKLLFKVRVPLAVVFCASTTSLVKVLTPLTSKLSLIEVAPLTVNGPLRVLVPVRVIASPLMVVVPVKVDSPLTAKELFKVVWAAVTLKSVVIEVWELPSVNRFWLFTHALPFQ